MNLPTLRALALAAALAAALPARAQPTAAEAPPPEPTRLFGWRVGGLFDVDLPRFDPPGTFRLQFNPRVSDLVRRSYLRVPTGVRWTVNDRVELHAEAEAFATHGLDDDTSAGYGIGELRFGARRLIEHWPRPDFASSVGVNVELPVGDPPRDLTDGRNHIGPYLVTEHRLARHPKWTVFGGVSADLVSASSVPLNLGRNATKDDSIALNAGATYDLGQVKWTLQTTYATTAIAGIDEHFLTVRPSVLWWVPRRYTLNSDTQWIVGIGLRAAWGPDGREFSTGSRVRAELTFGQAVQRMRDTWRRGTAPR